MANNDNFDLVLAIPCMTIGDKIKTTPKLPLEEESFLKGLSDEPIIYNKKNLIIKNVTYDSKSNLFNLANIFCDQIKEHGDKELILNDEYDNIKTEKKPLACGQVILYEDEKVEDFKPRCCYNFFCVHSELTLNRADLLICDVFYIIYFVVPDINYQDLTLLMDQAHNLWCVIKRKVEPRVFLTDFLKSLGYKSLGKIYRIIFSDDNQFKMITEGKKGEDGKIKLYNILASETYKEKKDNPHQIRLSENTSDYLVSYKGEKHGIKLDQKEKFFDDYTMYDSYQAYASLYSYYYIINEKNKENFYNRIAPDPAAEDFSSEANILFVLETEIFKITACLVLSKRITEQMENPNVLEIQKMFRNFIITRPLFEKLNYRYLGAQKEANFIYKQFRIEDIMADYDKKRELLRNYNEVTSSISVRRNSRILNCIGLLFTFMSGYSYILTIISAISRKSFNTDIIIQTVIIVVMGGIMIKLIRPINALKYLVRNIKRKIKNLRESAKPV
jgi:hypothetical protein